jgi:hypothetical protein
MNSYSESLQNQLLAWLLAENNAQTSEQPSVSCEDINGVDNPLSTAASPIGGDFESEWTPLTFELGEIPTVQERFQAVLKRRLQAKIQHQPPLFPWESQLVDYPDYLDNPSIGIVPVWGWAAQQSKLNLPISLPEKIFRQLLEKCQALVGSSLPLGAKLVQVVESLFPEDSQTLNDLAGLVLRSPSRSVADVGKMPILESDYDELQSRQQIALSLLTAKQLFENLTLPISATTPVVERQWLTTAGVLTVKVKSQSKVGVKNLRVEAELPSFGILKLQGDGIQAMAQSSSPGCLSVELPMTQPNQTYSLEIELKEIDQHPLLFSIVSTH